jgi:hypothetical protein
METGGWRLPETVSWKKRITWWLVIYLAAQLPLVLLWPFFFNYPWGLDPFLALNIHTGQEPRFRTAGYFVYLLHFALTMMLPSRKAFRILMWVLIILVSLNTVSCMRMTWPEWLHGMPKIEG